MIRYGFDVKLVSSRVLQFISVVYPFSLLEVSLFSRSTRFPMIVSQVLLGAAGFLASLYTFHVKKQHEKNPKYKALCDLGPNASCSRVLTSE